LEVSVRADSPEEIVAIAKAHWETGLQSAVLVANSVPEAESVPRSEMEPVIETAVREAHEKGIRGKEVTPFLLQRIAELTGGKSMRANLALLLNNASLAAKIARTLHRDERQRVA
jgi:pseudouridine-5'-phosphate glycosidase